MINIKEISKTRRTSSQIVKADRIAKGIRMVLDNIVFDKRDKTMHTRLSSAVLEWLKSPEPNVYPTALNEFTFSEPDRPIHEIWKVPIQFYDLFNGYTAVKIPAFNPFEKIAAPEGTYAILFFLTLGVCDISTGRKIFSSNIKRLYKFKEMEKEEEIFNMKSPKAKGNLMVAGITMIFMGKDQIDGTCQMRPFFQPSGIVAARYRS